VAIRELSQPGGLAADRRPERGRVISSAGLHALLRERPLRLSIVAPPGNVARLFEIVSANRRCRLFQDLDSAISEATPFAVVSGEARSA
jgi:hypothetical protein